MILDLPKIFLDGAILSALASLYIVITLWINPRLWLQDYPEDIRAQVSPKTEGEKRLSLAIGIPFLILLITVPFLSTLGLKRQYGSEVAFITLAIHAFGVGFIFNVVDWLVLDWLLFCTITPQFLVIPGTEGVERYQKDYAYHFRGFLIGTVISAVSGLVIGAIVTLL